MLAQGALLIEWPERMERTDPPGTIMDQLEHKDAEEREMKVNLPGKRYDELLEVIRRPRMERTDAAGCGYLHCAGRARDL